MGEFSNNPAHKLSEMLGSFQGFLNEAGITETRLISFAQDLEPRLQRAGESVPCGLYLWKRRSSVYNTKRVFIHGRIALG